MERVENHAARSVFLTAIWLCIASDVTSGQSPVMTYTRWEATLNSEKDYDDPPRDVTVGVTYVGPEGRILRSYGFWDGGRTFRIRCAYPVPGLWRWKVTCSDAGNKGLHEQSGAVQVMPYEGENQLYQHGFLRVSANKRYLCYADGTPFLWIGDTAWLGAAKSTAEDWRDYLDDRVRKHFTVIQIGPATTSSWSQLKFPKGAEPFLGAGITRINPAFWREYEARVQSANEHGLFVMAVGQMEPTFRYPDSAEACLFAREFTARLYGNFIAFSPSFDSPYMSLAKDVGMAIREATAEHLITQHPGTPSGKIGNIFAEAYYDHDYVDFIGNQTGHNYGRRDLCARQAISWNLRLYEHRPHKPVVNLEAYYHGGDNKGGVEKDARSLGWISLLSGAKGYTYGCGVYHWDVNEAAENYWRKCLTLSSSDQMNVLHDFLSQLAWWQLEPAHQLIQNQPKLATEQMVLARTPDCGLAVAYLQVSKPIVLDLTSFPNQMRGQWFHPVEHNYTPIVGRLENREQELVPPEGGDDWVLLLTKD